MFFSRLDKYILRAFIPTFLLCLLIISGIYTVIDILQKLEDLIDMGGAAFRMGVHYYAYLFPVIVFQFFPAVTLIAVSLVLVRLFKNKELLAMQVAGISLYRILLPVFVVTVFLSFASFGDQEWVIPRFAEKIGNLEHTLFDSSLQRNVLVYDRDSRSLFRIWRYNNKTDHMQSVFILTKYADGKKKCIIRADDGRWTESNTWALTGVTRHNYDEEGRWVAPVQLLEKLEFKTSLSPDKIEEKEIDPSLLSFRQLKKLCKSEPENPRNSVLFHSRVAYPLSHFVLLLLGIPLMIGFERFSKNLFLRVGLNILACCVFYALSFFCSNLGNTGMLHPVLAAWLPIIIFGSSGLLLFDMMKM